MKRNKQERQQQEPAQDAATGFLCALTALVSDAEHPAPRPAFGLLVLTPALQEAITDAYDQLARGVPGTVEIPLALPIVSAKQERKHAPEPVPNIGLLKASLTMLELNGGHFTVGAKTIGAFNTICAAPNRKNAVLQVSRHQSPRIRSDMRGGRHRYISAPIPDLELGHWCGPPQPGKPALTLVPPSQGIAR